MDIPKTWRAATSSATSELPPTIRFRSDSGAPFEVLVTPIWPAKKDVPPPDAASLRKVVQQAADASKSQAIEKTIAIVEIKGTSGVGYYFSMTDRAPKSDEFKFGTQGIIGVNNLRMSFTILTNDGQQDVVNNALKMIMSATHIASSKEDSHIGELRREKDAYRISRGSNWWIEFPSSDFKIKNEKHRPDGSSDYYMFTSESKRLNVSFYVEPTLKCFTSEECRDMYWSNPGPLIKNPQRVSKYDLNGFAIVEFYLPEIKIQQFTIDQMNISGHAVRGGYWVDMHISKIQYRDSDKDLFEGFVKSISYYTK